MSVLLSKMGRLLKRLQIIPGQSTPSIPLVELLAVSEMEKVAVTRSGPFSECNINGFGSNTAQEVLSQTRLAVWGRGPV